MDVLASAKFPPCEVTFVVSGIFVETSCTCFCEVLLPKAETSTSNREFCHIFSFLRAKITEFKKEKLDLPKFNLTLCTRCR